MLKFNKIYFILFFVIFLIEILIAKYATGFLRHTIGDYLAVMFVYTFIKSIFKISTEKAVLITFAISFIIEFLQLSNLQNHFPKEYSQILKLILGTSFSIGDLIAYTLGVITIYLIEKYFKKIKTSS
ncbi:ribosomal maturation YjgA family protein [Polaribacter sp. SA4-12]|uniref:ribosomal maturation YjgA family protein n=1 Tax=Polaribacter sp. SA4-12 TaxID=1312072 RepID=UPI000B3C3A73|nr:DUF2809 domain-containing protein [Polaribacter sp. SA4-12]ARV16648.1 hypothetical protein BTO07_16555 [Polaribacter sp. SA4-12]